MIKTSALPGAFHFNMARSPGPQTLGKMFPRRAGGSGSRPFLVPMFPALRSNEVCSERKKTWQPARPFRGRAQEIFATMASLHLVSGSAPASLRFFYSLPLSHSSREVGRLKRREMTLILCFQKAHKQNLDTEGRVGFAYQ